MEPAKDAGPPPVDGLGNYKGVMLCNRPTEQSSRAGPALAAPEKAPFRPSGAGGEPTGLNPAKDNLVSNMISVRDEATRRRLEDGDAQRPTNFLTKHRQWLTEMAQKKATLNAELSASASAAEAKRTRFVAYTREMRQAVRQRAQELQELGEDCAVQWQLEPEPQTQLPIEDAVPLQKPKSKPAVVSKPMWAMTEAEADVVEEGEAEDLVDFAMGLDYDSYIDDLEVRQALNVIRERIDGQKALEAAAAAAEEASAAGGDWRSQFLSEWNANDDETATVRSSKRAPVLVAAVVEDGGQPEWDASTRAGDEGARVSSGARAVAEQMLHENPSLAQKHSVRSLAKVVEKYEPSVEELPPLRVVTVVENPKMNTKTIDPSNLPYLHRNPAV